MQESKQAAAQCDTIEKSLGYDAAAVGHSEPLLHALKTQVRSLVGDAPAVQPEPAAVSVPAELDDMPARAVRRGEAVQPA